MVRPTETAYATSEGLTFELRAHRAEADDSGATAPASSLRNNKACRGYDFCPGPVKKSLKMAEASPAGYRLVFPRSSCGRFGAIST
jgi:hypothetical protein